ncbi:peptidase S9 (plasmid) [Kocuria flava]|uniref:Peptidase S9 n=1 Tax=Kocuria flava TaxID=446860 RepID=A0A0U3HJQ8_9MICC|nr:S9 family peptidase [Kocuria flava]ALU41433.1 peptidase S9 [Kocuria flava]GEO93560.1 peptidase S9 [Kocuria flava]
MTNQVPVPVGEVIELAHHLVEAWGSWGPTMTPDARRVAFISDRCGVPEVWVQEVVLNGQPPEAIRLKFSDDPVVAVRWSPDSAWLACAVATHGGVRTQVWAVRPDGTDARLLAGSPQLHAELGPWTRSGHHVIITIPSVEPGEQTRSFLVNPADAAMVPVTEGELIHVLDVSVEERLIVVRDGQRGQEFCEVFDRLTDQHHPLLPDRSTGTTEVALLRPSPPTAPGPLTAYVVTDAGLPRRQLIAMALSVDGVQGQPRTLAAREDAELENLDADDAGRRLLLSWNVAGCSELELLDTTTGQRTPLRGLPGLVATDPVLSRDGNSIVMAVEGPERPRELWHVETSTHRWTRITSTPRLPRWHTIEPTLETYRARDGLTLTGWLYRAPGAREPGPAALYLHGGPEGQERPTFNPQHQAMATAGITVFAPNVRGSSGFGRAFVHADEVHHRYDAFEDVLASADHLIRLGVADPARIAVTGRSYGGYLTLASLAFFPAVFAAGVDICGMSDLHTFYRDTEPWIAAAAITKYGHPERDRELLHAISPLRQAHRITAPLLVIHGELDTNVPLGEARQIVTTLEKLGRPVQYLQLAGEGHEYRRAHSRKMLITTMLQFLSKHLELVPQP